MRPFKASCQSTLLHAIQLTTGLDLGLPSAASQCVESPNRRLGGRITAEDMRQMNYAVDGERKDASEVVRDFLPHEDLLA